MISNELINRSSTCSQVLDLVPSWTWPVVRETLRVIYGQHVQRRPDQTTGDPGGFEQAELILNEYYDNDAKNYELIEDAFRILGTTETLYTLEGLKLDTIPQTNA